MEEDLGQRLEMAWAWLAQGVQQRHSAAHTPALATVDAQGQPQVRTLVLRAVDAPARRLRLHSDRRSAKWQELSRHPACQLLIYDAGLKRQLRLAGGARVAGDSPLADQAWTQSRAMSRRCYQQQAAPGTPAADPVSALRLDEDEHQARDRFGVIEIEIHSLDLLVLAAAGHRRSHHRWTAAGWVSSWVAP
ncbi:MAG TPA: pyridoxamine 5'-phosphate oxidase family protein [Nevskiaceae bacterium]|nr:pyridoxamine 5'-phosphate oxidase family protein [Nevskiaceae bacterium]